MEMWLDQDFRKYSNSYCQRFLEGYHNVDHASPILHPSSSSAFSSHKWLGKPTFNGDNEFEQTLLQWSVKRLWIDYDCYLDTLNDI